MRWVLGAAGVENAYQMVEKVARKRHFDEHFLWGVVGSELVISLLHICGGRRVAFRYGAWLI